MTPRLPPDSPLALTLTAAARALCIDRGTLRAWIALGAPGPGPHGYDLPALRDWREDRLAERAAEAGGDGERLLRARADEREERARLLRIRREELESELMPRALLRRRDRARVRAVQRGLDDLAARLVQRLPGLDEHQMRRVIAEEVRSTLHAFSSQ